MPKTYEEMQGTVLIESDWNLKSIASETKEETVERINRIRLEFKEDCACPFIAAGRMY